VRELAALFGLVALGAAPPGRAQLAVTLTPGVMSESSGSGTIDVDVTLEGASVATGAPLFTLGVAAPGMIDPQPVEDFEATDAGGPVPLTENLVEGSRIWRTNRATRGAIRAHYRLPISNARGSNPPVAIRIDGDAFSSPGRALIAIPPIPSARVTVHWSLSQMGPGAVGVSSYGDGDFTLAEGPLERLELALFMAGHLQRLQSGSFAAVWGGKPPFDPRGPMAWTSRLHHWMSRFFGDRSEPPYRVFLRGNPQNPGGGAAMIHSFIVGYGADTTGQSLTAILGHEMTHTWTANDAIGKWYTEGNAVYYQSQLPWRAGLISTETYLAELNLTASRYYSDAMRDTPEDQVMPHFWQDTRIRVLPYDRGALYFAALNGMILRGSRGRRSVDDLIKTMDARREAGEKLGEPAWLALVASEVGEDGLKLHRTMLTGGLVLPRSEDFGPCFRRNVQFVRQFDIGFDTGSLLGDRIVRQLVPQSEAARAGLRNGDTIVAFDGGDAVQRDARRTATLKGVRDGKAFAITYLPRGKAVPVYQWERVTGRGDRSCRPKGSAVAALDAGGTDGRRH
jgi:hypothetical protein